MIKASMLQELVKPKPIPFYQKNVCSLITGRMWCLVAYQSAYWPPGFLSVSHMYRFKVHASIQGLLTFSPTLNSLHHGLPFPQLLILLITLLILIYIPCPTVSSPMPCFCFFPGQVQSTGHAQSASFSVSPQPLCS